LLVWSGAKIKCLDRGDKSPLDRARESKHEDIIVLLENYLKEKVSGKENVVQGVENVREEAVSSTASDEMVDRFSDKLTSIQFDLSPAKSLASDSGSHQSSSSMDRKTGSRGSRVVMPSKKKKIKDRTKRSREKDSVK